MKKNEASIWRGAGALVAGLLASTLFVPVSSAATITTTSTFNTWKGSSFTSGAPTELNFLAINSSNYNTAAGVTLSSGGSAATFVGTNGASYSLTGDIYNKTLASASTASAKINVAFQTPQNAFMVFFSNPSAINYTVTLSDGQSFATNARGLGFALSYTVTGMSISAASGSQAVLNDFYFGMSALAQDPTAPTSDPSTATPEPATLALLAGGGFLLAGCTRRRAGTQVTC